VLIPGEQASVPTLGRATRAVGKKAAELLPILDGWARQRVREVAADDIGVSRRAHPTEGVAYSLSTYAARGHQAAQNEIDLEYVEQRISDKILTGGTVRKS
jgi:hypothetical protein